MQGQEGIQTLLLLLPLPPKDTRERAAQLLNRWLFLHKHTSVKRDKRQSGRRPDISKCLVIRRRDMGQAREKRSSVGGDMAETGIATGGPTALTKRSKVLLSIDIYICFIVMGAAYSLLGPGRLDIAELIGVDFKQISYGQSGRAFGSAFGALVCAWVFSKTNRQLGLIASLLVGALSLLIVPFIRILWLYVALEVIFGFAGAAMDVACNSWLLEIWEADVNPWMQALHFSFAIGMTIAPLIEEPFLSPYLKEIQKNDSTSVTHANETLPHEQTRIVIPYSMAAAAFVAVAVLFTVLYFKMPYIETKRTVASPKQSEDGHTQINSSNNNNDLALRTGVGDIDRQDLLMQAERERQEKVYHVQMIVLGSLLLCFYIGFEISTFNFMSEFAVLALSSKPKGAFLTSVTSAAFAGNRFISIFMAAKIKPKTMLYMSFALLSIGNILLISCFKGSEVMIWIAAMIIGVGHSCVFPCIMSFLETRLNITTFVCGIFILSSCISSVAVPFVIGSYITSHPLVYVYINIGGLIACAGIFSVLYIIDRHYRRRLHSSSYE